MFSINSSKQLGFPKGGDGDRVCDQFTEVCLLFQFSQDRVIHTLHRNCVRRTGLWYSRSGLNQRLLNYQLGSLHHGEPLLEKSVWYKSTSVQISSSEYGIGQGWGQNRCNTSVLMYCFSRAPSITLPTLVSYFLAFWSLFYASCSMIHDF